MRSVHPPMSLVGRTGRRAFTLMEVVVTLVVIGLILISVPVYGRIMDRSEQSRTEVELEAVARRVQALAVIGGDDNLMSVDQLEAAVAATDLDATGGAGLVAAGTWDVVRNSNGDPVEWRFDEGATTVDFADELAYGTVGFDFATYREGGYDLDADMTASGHVLTLVTEDPDGGLVYARVSEEGSDTWTGGGLDLSVGEWPYLELGFSYAGGEGSNTTTTIVEAAPTSSTTAAPSVPPTEPENVAAVTGLYAINLTWDPPADSGTHPVDHYEITYTPQGSGVPVTATSATTSYTVAAVTPGEDHAIEVRAVTAAGTSAPAATAGWAARKYVRVETGDRFGCGLEADTNDLYCWGEDLGGNLGRGLTTTTGQVYRPALVEGGLKWKGFDVGYQHVCAVTTAGRAYCWGAGSKGQLGNNSTAPAVRSPTPVDTSTGLTDTNVASVSAGMSNSCAVTTAGRAYCWGAGSKGQLGNNNNAPQWAARLKPEPVDTTTGLTTTNVKQIAVGSDHACAVTTAGRAYCWGDNVNGQVGDNSVTQRNVPTAVNTTTGLTTTNVQSIAVGSGHACAVTTAGRAYCWGDNVNGQVGDNSVTQRNVPTAVNTTTGLTTTNVASVNFGVGTTSCALTTTGAPYCWGSGVNGQLGDNTVVAEHQSTVPVAPLTSTGLPATGLTSIIANQNGVCAVSAQGRAWCWGGLGNALGNHTVTASTGLPTPVKG